MCGDLGGERLCGCGGGVSWAADDGAGCGDGEGECGGREGLADGWGVERRQVSFGGGGGGSGEEGRKKVLGL